MNNQLIPSQALRLVAVERQRQIAGLVQERGHVRSTELVEIFGVTDETIRRDLSRLAEEGRLRRAHGGAIADFARTEHGFRTRLQEHEAEKRAIASRAAELVADGSTIIIDSGTTAVHFARALLSKRDLVVVTNAVTNATELMENPDVTVILTGGTLRPTTFGAVGDLAVSTLSQLHVDQAFIAIRSISIPGGLSYPSLEEVSVKQAMIGAASEVILLADHSKFGHESLMRVAPVEVLSRVVTTAQADPEVVAGLRDRGIDVIIAAVGEAMTHPSMTEPLALGERG